LPNLIQTLEESRLAAMTYDYKKLYDVLVQMVRSDDAIQHRMLGVIAECESQIPHGDWEQLKSIDFNQEIKALNSWLDQALSDASSTTKFKGLWFGLSNPYYADEPTADVYVAASPEFNCDDIKWACNATFYPKNGALRSKVLNSIYRIAYDTADGLCNDAEYPLVLAYGAMMARTALEKRKFDSPFDALEGAAVGFDSGDLLLLGRFADGKFISDVQAG
jgi:hypothetical protein